jgi:hypothetical protein
MSNPSPDEARSMFDANLGLAMVTVDIDGKPHQMHRDGQIDPVLFIHNPMRDGTPLHGDLPSPGKAFANMSVTGQGTRPGESG